MLKKRRVQAVLAAILAVGGTGTTFGFSLGGSTQAVSMVHDLTRISKLQGKESGKQALDGYFDQAGRRSGDSQSAGISLAGVFGFTTNLLQPARQAATSNSSDARVSKAPPAPSPTSNEPAKKQCCLDNLQSNPDGSLYRVRRPNDHAWYKPWTWFDNTRLVEKGVPGSQGAMFNDKGEFVGDWQVALKTDTDRFQVAKGQDGREHIYTFKRGGWWGSGDWEISKDGKYAASLQNNTYSASLSEFKIGQDEKIYARYQKNAEDVFVQVNPSNKQQKVVARVPSEIDRWTHTHHYQETHTDSDDSEYSHSHTEYHEHVDRTGVDKFEVTPDGRLFTLFKGNVVEESGHGERRVLAGERGWGWYRRWYEPGIDDLPPGNVNEFRIDSYGNLYTVDQGQVRVNDSPLGHTGWGWERDLRIDDQGNVYKVEGVFNKTIRQLNVLPDPANGDRIAAPVPGDGDHHHDHGDGHDHG